MNINDIPDEILNVIFNYIDFKSDYGIAAVCKRWRQILPAAKLKCKMFKYSPIKSPLVTWEQHLAQQITADAYSRQSWKWFKVDHHIIAASSEVSLDGTHFLSGNLPIVNDGKKHVFGFTIDVLSRTLSGKISPYLSIGLESSDKKMLLTTAKLPHNGKYIVIVKLDHDKMHMNIDGALCLCLSYNYSEKFTETNWCPCIKIIGCVCKVKTIIVDTDMVL